MGLGSWVGHELGGVVEYVILLGLTHLSADGKGVRKKAYRHRVRRHKVARAICQSCIAYGTFGGFTSLVYSGESIHHGQNTMPAARTKKAGHDPSSVRASISFPKELYRRLEDLAREKKVSLAWVVRDAVEGYLARSPGPSGAKRTRTAEIGR